MKEQLELNDLAPYLGHGLQLKGNNSGEIYTLKSLRENALEVVDGSYWQDLYDFKPLLHPLSRLTEEITVEGYNEGKPFVPIDELNKEIISDKHYYLYYDNGYLKYFLGETTESNFLCDPSIITEKLYQWHFDTTGLIDRNLALPIPNKENN